MIAPLLDASSQDALKRALLDGFPYVKSSHLTEALAFGLGFRTHAALKTVLDQPEAERPPMSLDLERLCARLRQFGYLDDNARHVAERSVDDLFPGWLSAIKPADDRDTMTVGFDPFNLEVAVDAVMKSAAEKEQDITFSMYTAKRVDLRDREQVRTHLMDQVRRHYAQAKQHPDGIRIASIERVIYSPIAFVFEENVGEMHPPPVGAETEDPITHLAYFWSVL